ncbi:hypothetical protein ACVIWV_001421 [Bradyrhizobium diazoefficiens]|uniref:Uncharacterized protein n=3 Tax=Bradyrhizobium diazoefficiens TaxID=1355477 RepID=A0A810C562_9BRAD|nr:hypothetical protein [Bradyrhizobium diazoefficiens]BCA05865.1 hypothetical protein H12S4_67690 [Bradyrhizobium diazoefficiens]BCA23218.1 hypothetical protein BDHH15_64330 [Bradyrhizobium diazoefficiens]BCE41376.1 hypothetical protein XF3B_64070 [Bradyrhizobium diazoefficiens]BCE82765.1 hypothetical protein XF9B_41860 [Bradyrhizobium diazoefficiens]BCF02336.1 hypothetical protein XF11B_63560 [Bradyrhizobium diazoefficiens]
MGDRIVYLLGNRPQKRLHPASIGATSCSMVGGETKPDDYVVIWDEIPIGRIFKSIAVGGRHGWTWSCFLPNVPQRSHFRGIAPTLASAKADFRSAWDELQSNVSYDQICEARRLGAAPSRPWQG